MSKKRANLTDLLNDLTYKVHYDKNKLICMNEHEWEGLPDGIEPRHIESLLFNKGSVLPFAEKTLACGDRNARSSCDVYHAVNVFGKAGLFDKEGIVGL